MPATAERGDKSNDRNIICYIIACNGEIVYVPAWEVVVCIGGAEVDTKTYSILAVRTGQIKTEERPFALAYQVVVIGPYLFPAAATVKAHLNRGGIGILNIQPPQKV